MSKSWYKVESTDGFYYTPFATTKKGTYKFPGNGETDCTPRELADFLNQHDDCWAHDSGKVVRVHEKNASGIDPTDLPAAIYMFEQGYSGVPDRLVPFELRDDEFIATGEMYERVKKSISIFLNNEDVYRRLGMIYKLGHLYYSAPGQGKTSMIRALIKDALPKDSIVIFLQRDFPCDEFILKVKETLKDRLKVFVFEELAAELTNYFIGKLLNFLDGELSVDKSIVMATTNYPEKLPGNIVDRPSRFDQLYKFGDPKESERKLFIKHFTGNDATEEQIKESKDLSVAAIKEACLLSSLNEVSLIQCFKLLKERSKLCKREFAENKAIGFGGRDEDDDF